MKKWINLSILVLLATVAYGQQAGERITKTTVGLFTDAHKKIKVQLGELANRLDTIEIADYVWYSKPYQTNPIIKIKTGQKNITYRLRPGYIYMVYWNNRKKYWDLKRTTRKE